MPIETFIRFVTDQKEPITGKRMGIFSVAYRLWHEGSLAAADRAELRNLLDWFDCNLERPTQLAVSRRAHANETALSWICAGAGWHVVHFRRLAAVLREAGVCVDELETTEPGRVIYRDAHQVLAFPVPTRRIKLRLSVSRHDGGCGTDLG